jgi:hypothetical protein
VEAKRQARKKREQDAVAAAAAAKRPVGRPKGSGKKPGPAVRGPAAAAVPQQLVWVRIVCQPGAPAGRDIARDNGLYAPQPQPAPAPVSKNRPRAAAQPCVQGVGRGGGPVTWQACGWEVLGGVGGMGGWTTHDWRK